MKKLLFTLLLFLTSNMWGYAQKGETCFSFQGGYENFSKFIEKDGYNFALNLTHYVNNRIYAVANFHTGLSNRNYNQKLSGQNSSYEIDNKLREYMLGLGLGADIFHKKRHVIYVQSTVGLGVIDEKTENINISDWSKQRLQDNHATFALSFTAGYDYQLNDWLTMGINYTGYQIRSYRNSCNLKIGIIF